MGYIVEGQEDKVLKLKALYRLKQAPRAWNSWIDKYFHEHGFIRCMNEYALYVKKQDDDFLFVYIYVDDLIYTGNNPSIFGEFKKTMTQEFEMTDMGPMPYYLALRFINSKMAFSSPKKVMQRRYSKNLTYLVASP